MPKPHSIRVSPLVTPGLIRHLANKDRAVAWDTPKHDSFTTFTGTGPAIAKAEAFSEGFQSGYRAAEQELSQAFIDGRLKKRKERGGFVKVWTEPKHGK